MLPVLSDSGCKPQPCSHSGQGLLELPPSLQSPEQADNAPRGREIILGIPYLRTGMEQTCNCYVSNFYNNLLKAPTVLLHIPDKRLESVSPSPQKGHFTNSLKTCQSSVGTAFRLSLLILQCILQ